MVSTNHSKSRLRIPKFWSKIQKLLSIVFLFEVPIRICFRVVEKMGFVYQSVTYALDGLLWMDIALKFVTAYVNKKSVLTFNLDKIGKHYLSGEFTLDVVAAAPLDLLALMSTVGIIYMFRLVTVLYCSPRHQTRT